MTYFVCDKVAKTCIPRLAYSDSAIHACIQNNISREETEEEEEEEERKEKEEEEDKGGSGVWWMGTQ